MDQHDALATVVGRCTGPAWQRLRQLQDDPLFPDIVQALQQVAGTIASLQVEALYLELQQYQNEQRQAPRAQHPVLH